MLRRVKWRAVALHINTHLFVVKNAMDSSRVLIAIQEKLKWEGRKERIEEKLRKIRMKKLETLKQLEQVKGRIAQLTALGAMAETDLRNREGPARIDGLR